MTTPTSVLLKQITNANDGCCVNKSALKWVYGGPTSTMEGQGVTTELLQNELNIINKKSYEFSAANRNKYHHYILFGVYCIMIGVLEGIICLVVGLTAIDEDDLSDQFWLYGLLMMVGIIITIFGIMVVVYSCVFIAPNIRSRNVKYIRDYVEIDLNDKHRSQHGIIWRLLEQQNGDIYISTKVNNEAEGECTSCL